MEVKVLAPAKINLSLDVLSKRADGYHNISTVMQAVDLYDTITITDNESGTVTISCNCEGVPCDDSNICAKAAYKFFDYCKMDVKGIHIDIDKKIPTQAGLAALTFSMSVVSTIVVSTPNLSLRSSFRSL